MIFLNEGLFLGQGYHKATYQHPHDPSLCIKIAINSNKDAKKQLTRELKHNISLQKKHRKVKGLSLYLGTASTNLGKGYLFEVVKDYDGRISKSLLDYLNEQNFLNLEMLKLPKLLSTLKKNMLEQLIIPMNIEPQNILCKKSDENHAEFVIIDEIGTAAFVPLEYFFSFAAKKRIERKWNKFEKQLLDSFNFDCKG